MIRYVLAAIISGILLSGCRHDDQDWKEPKGPVPMTVLVYMAANNSMGRDRKDVDDINEMIAAAQDRSLLKRGRVVVFRAEYGGTSQRLMELTPDSLVTRKVYADTDVPATDPARLRQVIADTRDLAPADDYGLVLWSHSLGWTNSSYDEPFPSLRSFGQDRDTGRMMTISELGEALDPGSFKYVYFDCCLMGSVEVVYELRHAAGLFGVSVTEVPYNGLPYDKVLPLLLDGSRTAMISVAQANLEHYGLSTYGSCPVSSVVISAEGLDELASVTSLIYRNALPVAEDFKPQEFYTPPSRYPDYRFYDFAQYVEAICPDSTLLADWRKALDKVVAFSGNSDYIWYSIPIERHCGLSTRILTTAEDALRLGYDKLQWHRDVSFNLVTL